MKKSIKWSLLALPIALFALAAAGCGEEEHEHTFSEAWAFDAQSHWHAATCSHDAKANKSAHVFVETVVEPSEVSAGYTLHVCACGYSYTSDPQDAQPSDSGFRYDETGHWTPVFDGSAAPAATPHEFEDETVAPTCATAGYTKHTCVCGYWYADAPTAPTQAHETDEEIWAHSDTAHWHPCLTCGLPAELSAHDFQAVSVEHICDGDAETGTFTVLECADCGYSLRRKESDDGHTYSPTITSDEYTHWYAATCSHSDEVKKDEADHVFVGSSRVCSVCGREVEPRFAYRLSADKTYYIVAGMGSYTGTTVEIPATWREKPVKEIGSKAFEGTGISGLTIGAAVKIGQAAFRGCASLQSVTLTEDCTLEAEVFAECATLSTVSGTGKITAVGAQAFYGCAELTELDLSAAVKVGFSAFADCAQFAPASLAALTEAEQYAFAGTGIANAELTLLSRVEENMFEGCEHLQTVSLPAATGIAAAAFAGCTQLTAVTLPKMVTIGERAFENCALLATLELPATVTRVGANAFEGCTALITDETGVKYAANVLLGATAETANITVKAGTVGIIDEAFRNDTEAGNTTLTGVTLSTELRFIGVNAFRGCTGLAEIEFKANVKLIGANAFRASGLTAVTVPQTVETVGDNAFYDCKALASVNVSAKTIGKFAFSYTGVNRDLTHPVKQRPDYANLKTLTIGEGVESIGSNAFQYAPITAVTLPETLKTIGGYAFAQTDLTAIGIPAAVTRIGAYAFYESKLTSATFTTTAGWTAGGTALSLSASAQNAASLKAATIDWVRG